MSAPLRPNVVTHSDLQQTHFPSGYSPVLQDSFSMPTIIYGQLSNSCDATTTTTSATTTSTSSCSSSSGLRVNPAIYSYSTDLVTNTLQPICGSGTVPGNIYNRDNMYAVTGNMPTWNGGSMNISSNGYPRNVSSSSSNHSNGLSPNGNIVDLTESNSQTCIFNETKPSSSTGCSNWSASNGCRDWSTFNSSRDWSAFNGYNVQSTSNNYNQLPAANISNGYNSWSASNVPNGWSASNGPNGWSASNGPNGWSASNVYNSWSASNVYNSWSASNVYNSWSASNVPNGWSASNSCNDQSISNSWSTSNNCNNWPASNSNKDWSASPNSSYNRRHTTSSVANSSNTSASCRYRNDQNSPFCSHSVSGGTLVNCYNRHNSTPVNGSDSLYSAASNSTYYKVYPVLPVQSPQISSLTHPPDRNRQSTTTSTLFKSALQISRLPEHFVSNNIYQDSSGGFLVDSTGVEIKPQKKRKRRGKAEDKNTLKEKSKNKLQKLDFRVKSNDEPVVSVGLASHTPGCQDWDPKVSSGFTSLQDQEPVQRLNKGSRSSSRYICRSRQVSSSTRTNTLLSAVGSTTSLLLSGVRGRQLLTRTNTSSATSTLGYVSITGSSTGSTSTARTPTSIWKMLLNEVQIQTTKKSVARQTGSGNNAFAVRILNHDGTKVYFGTREKPAQIPSFDDLNPTKTHSSDVPTDPIEAEYVAEVERFRKIQEESKKNSLVEQLFL